MNAARATSRLNRDPRELQRRADRVRDRLLLSAVIGKDVKLVRAQKEFDGLCPFHPDQKMGSFKVNDSKALYKCFSCGAHGDHFKYLMARKNLTFIEALRELEQAVGLDGVPDLDFSNAQAKAEYDRARERQAQAEADDREKRRRKAEGLWLWAPKLRDTPGQFYLEGRGIDFERLGSFPGALRFRPDCWNSELRREVPALLAAMIDPLAAKPHVATHRTYLEYVRGKWVKARLDKPKMILGTFTGAHIPLHKGKTGRVGLRDVAGDVIPRASEGIEDGLSVAMAAPERRYIAAATMGNIGALHLPPQVRGLELIEQNDDLFRTLRAMAARAAGDMAAVEQHERASRQIEATKLDNVAALQGRGLSLWHIWPAEGFKDFNDQLRGVRMEGAHG